MDKVKPKARAPAVAETNAAPYSIDVGDLREEEIRQVRDLVESLRGKRKTVRRKTESAEGFARWPLGAKGKLTRKEIYGIA